MEAVLRVFQAFFKLFRPHCLDKLIRILVRFQMKNAGFQPGCLYHGDGAKPSFYAGSVAVIAQDHFIGIPFEQTAVLLCQRRSQRGNRIGKARLMHGNHIHVAFADDQIFSVSTPRNVQPVHVPALIKNRRFR